MKILCIGNSFSQDATRYLQEIAEKNGDNYKVTNLFIGGCSLEMHYNNIIEDAEKYNVQTKGQFSLEYTSISKALKSDKWDIVTVQQASHFSFDYSTYQPYLDFVVKTVREILPSAKIYVHQTWAYNDNSERLKTMGFSSSEEMFENIQKSYNMTFNDINAYDLLPSGKLILSLSKRGVINTHRDGFHLSLGIGRYSAGLLWYYKLSKKTEIVDIDSFDEEVSKEDIALAKEIIKTL